MSAAPGEKRKAHEFAKELGLETREVIALAAEIGEKITNPQSSVTPEQQEKLRAQIRKKTGEKTRQVSNKISGKDIMARLKAAHEHASSKPKPAPKPAAAAPAADAAASASPAAEVAPVSADAVIASATPAAPVSAVAEAPAPPAQVEPLPPPSLRVVKPPAKPVKLGPIIEEVAAPSPSAPAAPVKPSRVEPLELPKLRIKKDEPRVIVLKKMDAPNFTINERPNVSGAVVAMPIPGQYQPPRATARPGQRRSPPPPPAGGRPSRKDRRMDKAELAKHREETRATEMAQVIEKAKAAGEVIFVREGITVKELADKLTVKARDVIQKLFMRRLMATINQTLDEELIKYTCAEFGRVAEIVSFEDELVMDESAPQGGTTVPRAPVVTVMGHVDHGKSSLLMALHSVDITTGEAGGITQHIGAYRVDAGGKPVTFIDTPGHEAFTMMRARGARVTDIVILVVAADDGVMPQTIEAIHHAQAAKVPIIVAINKIDKPGADPERVKPQLAQHNLFLEGYGGETPVALVSAKKKTGIKELIELIHLVADLKHLTAAVDKPARATVLEARLDKAKGPVATVIVQEGTLRAGDVFVSGSVNGRVRAMFDDRGMKIAEAGPSMPVEVLGFTEVSAAGDMLQVVEDEAKARQIASYRVEQKKGKAKGKGVVSLDDLFAKAKQGELQELAVIIKADTDGSVEVLKSAIEGCASPEIGIRVLHAATGGITETDINLAAAAGAIVIGFNARPDRKAAEAAEAEGVDVRLHSIIYKVTDEIKAAMQGLIKPKEQETVLGRAEVREIFKVSKVGLVAGCMVVDGKLTRAAQYRVLRDGVVLHTGKLASLKRFKEDVTEVRSGFDCGASIERFADIKAGDHLEAFIIETIAVPAPAESVN